MASLNDFNWPQEQGRAKKTGPGTVVRRWSQIILAAAFFLLISHYIDDGGKLGQFSRYVMQDGLAIGSSWLKYDAILPAAKAKTAPDPVFLMPLLGVAVRDYSLDSAANGADTSLVIQGENGDAVNSTAQGQVTSLTETATGWTVKITHDQGFMSVYQGLFEVTVEEGQEIAAGQTLGTVADDPLIFSLFKDGVAVDPLKWLFKDDLNGSVT